MVEQFHRKYDYSVGKPLSRELMLFRLRLIAEEFGELAKSFDQDQLSNIGDALADLAYVVYGTAVTFGFPLDALIAEVHRSNMTKEFSKLENKPVKGKDYSPPRILKVLALQHERNNEGCPATCPDACDNEACRFHYAPRGSN
jgi:NTP pyrophosphatase (non-canonical NTP hydrolase)